MVERPILEAVIFDAGGTLVRLDFEWMAQVVGEAGVTTDAATLRRAEVDGRRAYDHSRRLPDLATAPLGGPGDIRRYFGGMLEAVGLPAARIDAVIDRFIERERSAGLWTHPMEGARAAVEAIGALGLRRAVVSNSDGRAEWHLQHTDVRAGLEFVIDSYVVGVEKPDPAIFRLALERLGVAAPRALYVGDIRSVDEAGAAAAGMHFVLIDPTGSYGADGGPALRSIEALPAWVAERFQVPRPLVTPSHARGD